MCYASCRIYGMQYEFYGCKEVEEYLSAVEGIDILDDRALDRWFSYLQSPQVTGKVERIVVISTGYADAQTVIRNPVICKAFEDMQNSPAILGQQAGNFLLINYEGVQKKAKDLEKSNRRNGVGVFFAILLHETTHLLDEYLTGGDGLYTKITPIKRQDYHNIVLLPAICGGMTGYLREVADYQKEADKDIEGLSCLVEALTFLHFTNPGNALLSELQSKLCAAIDMFGFAIEQN